MWNTLIASLAGIQKTAAEILEAVTGEPVETIAVAAAEGGP